MIYVDDSGSEDAGLNGWIEVSPEAWRRGLRAWLNMRKKLFQDYAIHVSTELHCTKYLQGRSQITSAPPARFKGDAGAIRWKDLGREVGLVCLETLRDCEDVHVGAVYRHTSAKGRAFHQEKVAVYTLLVDQFDHALRETDSYGFITMDGEDPAYRDAHRALTLDTRHVIEDPAYLDSRTSQWTQMADLVAYTANIHLNRHPGNEFGWEWFTDYLSSCGTVEVI